MRVRCLCNVDNVKYIYWNNFCIKGMKHGNGSCLQVYIQIGNT